MIVLNPVLVEAVLEARAECSDADRARIALNEALAAARAPAHGSRRLESARWTVTMTVAAASGTATGAPKSVEAVIVDDAGIVIAQRTLTDRSARACLPLAHAVGAWASLVLDAEMNRAKDGDGVDALTSAPLRDREGAPGALSRDARAARDAYAARDAAPPDVTSEPVQVSTGTIELGTMAYLRNGMSGSGGLAGVTPFMTVEVSPGWVLRPALFFGRSTATAPAGGKPAAPLSHLAARADFCRRIPGNYNARRGVELDLCAGMEGGAVTSDGPRSSGAARFGAGPSANLRGELGAGLALEVRGLLGANLVTAALADDSNPPLVFAAGELGVSVRLP